MTWLVGAVELHLLGETTHAPLVRFCPILVPTGAPLRVPDARRRPSERCTSSIKTQLKLVAEPRGQPLGGGERGLPWRPPGTQTLFYKPVQCPRKPYLFSNRCQFWEAARNGGLIGSGRILLCWSVDGHAEAGRRLDRRRKARWDGDRARPTYSAEEKHSVSRRPARGGRQRRGSRLKGRGRTEIELIGIELMFHPILSVSDASTCIIYIAKSKRESRDKQIDCGILHFISFIWGGRWRLHKRFHGVEQVTPPSRF